jgi:undecaprenyl-diphosphatase
MHDTLNSLLGHYGYAFLFVIVGLESLGVPLPGETALVTAAAYAALGHLDIRLVVVTAAAAAIAGDSGGYWIGREGGLALVRRWGRRIHVNEHHLTMAHAFFERHGGKTVFIGRFVAILRTWAAILAGVAHMPYGEFFLYNATGGIVWAVVFGTLGYVFGRNLPRLEHNIGQASLVLVLLVALVVALYLFMRWFGANRERVAGGVAARWTRVIESPRMERVHERHPRAWQFIADRFARGEYLGIHLTLGLIVSLAALWIFGAITEDVVTGDPLTQFDLTVLQAFRAHATPTGDRIMQGISLVGSPQAMALLWLVTTIVLAVRRRWLALGGVTAAFVGGTALDVALKFIIHRPRPAGAAMFLRQFSYSFPSGHAMGSLVGLGMVAYLLVVFRARSHAARSAVIVATVVLVLAIGLSRLYLGVHYFSDVMGGYAAGLVWLAACISGVEIARRQPHPATVTTRARVPS